MEKQTFTKSLKEKKGIAGLEVPKAIMIGVLGLVLVAFLIILVSMKMVDNFGMARTGVAPVGNEFLGLVNTTTIRSLTVEGLNLVDCSITSAQNASNGKLIPSGNWSEPSQCKITQTKTSKYSNRNWSVNYTFSYVKVDKKGTLFNTTATEVADNTSSNIGLLIFLGFLVVVVVLVSISLFYLSKMGGGSDGQRDNMTNGNEGA